MHNINFSVIKTVMIRCHSCIFKNLFKVTFVSVVNEKTHADKKSGQQLLGTVQHTISETDSVHSVESFGVHESHQFVVPSVPLMDTSRALAVVVGDEAVLVSNMPKSVQRSCHMLGYPATKQTNQIKDVKIISSQFGWEKKQMNEDVNLNPFMAPMVLTIPSPC